MDNSMLGKQPECLICAIPYNRSDRLPTFLCTNNHTICRSCLNDIRYRAPQCPFCRENIDFDSLRTDHETARKIPREAERPASHFQDAALDSGREAEEGRGAYRIPGTPSYIQRVPPGVAFSNLQPAEQGQHYYRLEDNLGQ